MLSKKGQDTSLSEVLCKLILFVFILCVLYLCFYNVYLFWVLKHQLTHAWYNYIETGRYPLYVTIFILFFHAAFCMSCNLLMQVEDAIGDHTEKAYSRAGLLTALFVAMSVSF